MNPNRSSFFALALAITCAPAFGQIVTGNELVRIEARVASEQDRKDLRNTTADTVTQRKTLFATLSGKPKNPETRTGKWIAYGHSAKDHDIVVLESGEFKIDLSNGGRQAIESKIITTTYTPEHATVTTRNNNNNRNRGDTTRAKKVEATGTKFAGFGIVINDGGKIVGESYDPPGLKQAAAK